MEDTEWSSWMSGFFSQAFGRLSGTMWNWMIQERFDPKVLWRIRKGDHWPKGTPRGLKNKNNLYGIVNPVRNSNGALTPALRGGTPYGAEPGIILKSYPAAAAGPGSAPEGLLPRREGLWPGGSRGGLFLTGEINGG